MYLTTSPSAKVAMKSLLSLSYSELRASLSSASIVLDLTLSSSLYEIKFLLLSTIDCPSTVLSSYQSKLGGIGGCVDGSLRFSSSVVCSMISLYLHTNFVLELYSYSPQALVRLTFKI